MTEDLNKLRELAESLQAGSAGFVRYTDFLSARRDFADLANHDNILELFSRLQAAEERAGKLEHIVSVFLACHDNGPGLIDCIDNHGERYTSASLFSAINAAREGFALKTEGA